MMASVMEEADVVQGWGAQVCYWERERGERK